MNNANSQEFMGLDSQYAEKSKGALCTASRSSRIHETLVQTHARSNLPSERRFRSLGINKENTTVADECSNWTVAVSSSLHDSAVPTAQTKHTFDKQSLTGVVFVRTATSLLVPRVTIQYRRRFLPSFVSSDSRETLARFHFVSDRRRRPRLGH